MTCRPLAHRPAFEPCEDQTLTTLVFVLNGNSFNAAGTSSLTANAASVLRKAGEQVVQLAYPRINTVAAFNALAARIEHQAHGQAIGLVGFSAGGALALRLAASLRVSSVLDYYGVPDIQAYRDRHAADRNFRPIAGLAPYHPKAVSLLSGPVTTSAHIAAAFGQFDPNVRADTSSSDLLHDTPGADVFTYPGAHGVSIIASRPALEDFLAHLGW